MNIKRVASLPRPKGYYVCKQCKGFVGYYTYDPQNERFCSSCDQITKVDNYDFKWQEDEDDR